MEDERMSFHGKTEDKAETAVEVPRSISNLQEIVDELKQAIALQAKDRCASLLDQMDRARKHCNAEQLEWSRLGKDGRVGVIFADTLNEANVVRGRALVLTTGLGPF
jgi:hypothetical protein